MIRNCPRIAYDAFVAFIRDDGWAIASHIALSLLMSLFPFLIFVTALTGFLGTQNLSDQVALLLLEAWPEQVSRPIAREIENVLTTAHSGLLTIGGGFALYFSSSGIESTRPSRNPMTCVRIVRPWRVAISQKSPIAAAGPLDSTSSPTSSVTAPVQRQVSIRPSLS